ncbi:MAG: CocE/NonD family hydrolase [Planctomycetaceae bacterium]|nr:CocE/NonD family hydrolase [Planctomycetaceae bacterium]
MLQKAKCKHNAQASESRASENRKHRLTGLCCVFVLTCVIANCAALAVADEPILVITERDVAVPMRDGVILRANVFRPDRGGPYPVLVLRTPYGKPAGEMDRRVKAGYIVVTQDARGRFASDGEWESFVRFETHDAEDGFDTVEWAAKLPNANGSVGTFGASYNAFLQWRLAALRPPSLKAMAAFSIPARYTDLEGPGTIRPGRRLHWWVTSMSPDMRRRAGREGVNSKTEIRSSGTLANRLIGLILFCPSAISPRSPLRGRN